MFIQAFEVSLDGKQALLEKLLDQEDGSCLVFVRTKHGADRLAHRLTRDGFAAAVIHGDRSQSQRTAALAGFQQGRFRVLVATDLASRGIHVEGIAHVINYDLPMVAEDLIHRVGRFHGPCRGNGVASVFFGRDQTGDLRSLERTLGLRIERKSVKTLAPMPKNDVSRRIMSRSMRTHQGTRISNLLRVGVAPGVLGSGSRRSGSRQSAHRRAARRRPE